MRSSTWKYGFIFPWRYDMLFKVYILWLLMEFMIMIMQHSNVRMIQNDLLIFFPSLQSVLMRTLSQLFISLFLARTYVTSPLRLFAVLSPLSRTLSLLLYRIFRLLKQLRLEMILCILLYCLMLALRRPYWLSKAQTGISQRFARAIIRLL